MGRQIDDIISSLPRERREKIDELAQQKVRDMVAHARTLNDFRRAVGKTQAEVAKELGIGQNAVSQLERRSDTYVSTLRGFLGALGLTLEMAVVAKNGERISLPNFRPWEASMDDRPPAPKRAPAKRAQTAKRQSTSSGKKGLTT
ncbi:XRE family transcriptional regulator [Roseateles terrae]|uniref:Transcriptional regulator with XRE-family HTH domain n=1 Tax=Roseateles terrae TaxID=431060 RepID=A0ABR6GLN8_9BURK|nr:XRE family transcriptional regulator [Roseateles terrae]MBB3193022.1 transcriptional regulator with XRE-family HTH domain [Roseateles terrae]OWQ89736.1 hypothetical protein CDN98_04260 [Roseateles terrae]